MPLVGGEDSELGMTAKVALAFAALGAIWVATQTGVLQALLALGLGSPMVAGLLVLVVMAYWALDELEDDDDASDVISKTSDRAESATQGLLDGAAALILGLVAIAGTVGMEVFNGLLGMMDLAFQFPALGLAQVGTLATGLLGAAGALSPVMVGGIGIGLLVVGALARKRGETEG